MVTRFFIFREMFEVVDVTVDEMVSEITGVKTPELYRGATLSISRQPES